MSEMRQSISLRIDNLTLPPMECSPNARVHRMAKARATKQWRKECALLVGIVARKRPRDLVCPVRIELEFYMGQLRVGGEVVPDHRYRPRDQDNAVASCKALIDSIVDAGVIPGDSAKYVSSVSATLSSPPRGGTMPAKVVLRIIEAGVPIDANPGLVEPDEEAQAL